MLISSISPTTGSTARDGLEHRCTYAMTQDNKAWYYEEFLLGDLIFARSSTFRLHAIVLLYRMVKEKSSSPDSGECTNTNDYCE